MKCIVEGCSMEAKTATGKTAGLCSGHGHRLRRYGSPVGQPKPKVLGICAVVGCERGLAGGGFCRKHYARFQRHGDPLGGSTDWGAARKFVEEAAVSDLAECVIFPFSRDENGYGHLNINSGKYVGAHAYALTLRVGPKPSKLHEACHTCGNGQEACVNGSHLYWGTRKQNVADAIAHGTAKFWGVPVDAYSTLRAKAAGSGDHRRVTHLLNANDNGERRAAA